LLVLVHQDDFLPTYNQLKVDEQKNKALLEAINNVKRQLENSNLPLGAHHKRDTIPKYYITKYNLQSLYHFDMPDGHRLMYTIRRSMSDGKEALFLELLTHDEYNKRFGYFKKKSH
jgi:hypothetical protein